MSDWCDSCPPLPGWCSRRSAGQCYFLSCRGPSRPSDPAWHSLSPGNKREALIKQLSLKALAKQELNYGCNYSLYSGVRRWRVFLGMHSNYLFKLPIPLFHRYANNSGNNCSLCGQTCTTVISVLLVEWECLITHHFVNVLTMIWKVDWLRWLGDN